MVMEVRIGMVMLVMVGDGNVGKLILVRVMILL
jgi:GTPase SAR1 family protein